MATLAELQNHLGTLAAILWNYGATFASPTLDRYEDTGNIGFEITAELPGSPSPKPAVIKLSEIWALTAAGDFRRWEYAYDFVEYPLNRRRAFHSHDPEAFARDFRVLVHQHCEEILGSPACDHYFGLPVDAFEAIRRFATAWGQPGPLGCADLVCMS
jgi:hypothetical protein